MNADNVQNTFLGIIRSLLSRGLQSSSQTKYIPVLKGLSNSQRHINMSKLTSELRKSRVKKWLKMLGLIPLHSQHVKLYHCSKNRKIPDLSETAERIQGYKMLISQIHMEDGDWNYWKVLSCRISFFDSKDCFVLISHLCRQILNDCGDYKNMIKLITYDTQYRNTQAYPLFHVLISWMQRNDKPPE